jgi:hypothetical protein
MSVKLGYVAEVKVIAVISTIDKGYLRQEENGLV